ncbi:MAG: DUF1292 domain-containing protein [Clostridia bacterium]|nr:DUF1292 domain-containing protein [Clostridia bacterium]
MNDNEIMEEDDDGRVELIDDNGETHVFYHLGTMEYEGELYAFFEPEETIDNEEEGEVSIFRLGGEDSGELFPVEDEELLEKVFAEFNAKLDEEYDA